MEQIYCAYDHFNPSINKNTGEVEHSCDKYGSYLCLKCNSRYNGEKIKEYMETHERKE